MVKGQAHHRSAVLLHQGEDGVQGLLVPVHRVDNGLAAVDPQGSLQHPGVGGVQLEGGVGDPLEGLHRAHHHLRLVDLGQTHVHIQDVGPRLGLGQGLVQHVVHIPPAQGLFHQLFAGGIDPLPDDPHPVDGHGAGAAAHRRGHLPGHLDDGAARQFLPQQCDILRRSAAAAAVQLNAQPGQLCHAPGKLLRRNVIPRAPWVGQARIGLDGDRHGGPPGQLPHQRGHLPGAQGAVHSDGICPHPLQGQGRRGRVAAQEGAAPLLIGHGDDDGQAAVLLSGQQGGPGLLEVGHGLDQNQVRPGLDTGAHRLGKDIHRLLKAEGASGLQQLAGGPHVQGH